MDTRSSFISERSAIAIVLGPQGRLLYTEPSLAWLAALSFHLLASSPSGAGALRLGLRKCTTRFPYVWPGQECYCRGIRAASLSAVASFDADQT